ncbi:Complex III assembly protein translocase and chaperone [Sorochytrium milnesiophthora]
MQTLTDALASNPYFSAGFGLFGLGTAAAVLRQGVIRGSDVLRRRMLVTLEIPSKDKSYHWVLQYLRHVQSADVPVPATSSSTQRQSLAWWEQLLPKSHQLSVETRFRQIDNGASVTDFSLVPGVGSHYVRYRSAWFMISRQRDTKLLDLASGSPWETIGLTTLRRDAHLFTELLADAKEFAIRKQIGKTVIYTSYGPEWRPFGQPRKKRPLESVVLDRGVRERVLTDVQKFLVNWQWYNERGIPYRRGYLLYGPPGSGKSSFIQALAGELEYNICILNLSERGLTDDRLNHLLTVLPMRSIMLLEDVDAAFTTRRQQSQDAGYQHSMVTFSGLLNALDGVAAAEERIIFMTTNHLEKLDPALIRPGRVDVKAYIGPPTEFQVRQLFTRFFKPDQGSSAATTVKDVDSMARQFVAELKAQSGVGSGTVLAGLSMAALQGHFVVHRDDPAQAIARARDLFRDIPHADAQREEKK